MRVSTLLLALTTLWASLWLGGCAATTEFTRTSHEATPLHPAKSLIVAGLSSNEQLRRQYEHAFIAELEKAGIRGVAGSDLLPNFTELDMPALRARLETFSDRADAALLVQLVSLTRTPALSPTDMPADLQAPATRIGGIDFTFNAPATQDSGNTVLAVETEFNLYELPERRLLWTGIGLTHEANSTKRVARSHAKAVITALRNDGYFAATP